MNHWLHPEAQEDRREAAEFYREKSDAALSLALLVEFERSVDLLLTHPSLGRIWRHGKRRLLMKRIRYALIVTPSWVTRSVC